MVFVAQVIRASVCGSEGRGFEPHQTHKKQVKGACLYFGRLSLIAKAAVLKTASSRVKAACGLKSHIFL